MVGLSSLTAKVDVDVAFGDLDYLLGIGGLDSRRMTLNGDHKLSWNLAGREECSTDQVVTQIPMLTPWDNSVTYGVNVGAHVLCTPNDTAMPPATDGQEKAVGKRPDG